MRCERTVKAAWGIVLTCVLLLGLSGAAAAAEAIIRAVPAEFDFGTIDEGDPAEVTVSLENISAQTVEITNVRTN